MNRIQKNKIKVGAFISLVVATPFAVLAIKETIYPPQINYEVATVQGKDKDPGSHLLKPKYSLFVNHRGVVQDVEVDASEYASADVGRICLGVARQLFFSDEYFLADKDECESQDLSVSKQKDTPEVGDTHQNQAIENPQRQLHSSTL